MFDLSQIDPGYVAIAMLVSGLIGRAIPDTATGAMGVIRRFAKTIGLWIQDRKNDEDPA